MSSKPSPLTRVTATAIGEGRYIPTPSLDPRNIELIKGVNSDNIGYVRPAIDAFGTIHGALKRLSDARAQVAKDTSKTEANQILIIAKEAEVLQARATLAFDTARKRLAEGIKGIDEMLSGPLTMKADNTISAEIRAYFKSLPEDKRGAAVEAAVNAKDLTTLQAVLGGPNYLSGLSPVMQAHHTRKYRELTQPEAALKLDVMRRSLELIDQRAGLVFTEVEKAMGAKWDVVQQLRKTSDTAQQALLLINNPVQP